MRSSSLGSRTAARAPGSAGAPPSALTSSGSAQSRSPSRPTTTRPPSSPRTSQPGSQLPLPPFASERASANALSRLDGGGGEAEGGRGSPRQ